MFLQAPLGTSALVVAIDPGKVMNRVWVSDGEGLVIEPVPVPVSRAGSVIWNWRSALTRPGMSGW
jgi:hypothetical protein